MFKLRFVIGTDMKQLSNNLARSAEGWVVPEAEYAGQEVFDSANGRHRIHDHPTTHTPKFEKAIQSKYSLQSQSCGDRRACPVTGGEAGECTSASIHTWKTRAKWCRNTPTRMRQTFAGAT